MQVKSGSSKQGSSSKTTVRKSSTPPSASSVKKTAPSRPNAVKDTFTASKDVGKPNGTVPNFGSWALAAPPAPQAAAKPAPADPAPRVTPQPTAPVVQAPQAKAPESNPAEPGKPPLGEVGAKAFDDASWAAAQARHSADFANQAGNLLKNQTLTNTSAAALKPLNPAAGVLGGAAFGKQAYDSYQKGNYTEAALQGATSGTLLTTGAGLVKGGQLAAKVAGRAAPAVGGALQAYQGIKSGDTWDTVSGGTKIAGAAMIATGFGAPVGAGLIIGSYMADFGRWGYQKFIQ